MCNTKNLQTGSLSSESTSDTPVLSFINVSLSYPRHVSLLDVLFNKKVRKAKRYLALKNISFSLSEGDVLGIIGRNGSGKSTMTLACTQVYQPDSGFIITSGRVQLLSLGVGFKNEMSGVENVYISGSLLGFSRRQIDAMIEDIESFADIGDFFYEPVRTYSSGMKSRLAFAIATAVKPDILILDEVMATGDTSFKDKAFARMRNMRELARAAILVSHNPGQIRKLCNKVMWLENGSIVQYGDPVEVLRNYRKFCADPLSWKAGHKELFTDSDRA